MTILSDILDYDLRVVSSKAEPVVKHTNAKKGTNEFNIMVFILLEFCNLKP